MLPRSLVRTHGLELVRLERDGKPDRTVLVVCTRDAAREWLLSAGLAIAVLGVGLAMLLPSLVASWSGVWPLALRSWDEIASWSTLLRALLLLIGLAAVLLELPRSESASFDRERGCVVLEQHTLFGLARRNVVDFMPKTKHAPNEHNDDDHDDDDDELLEVQVEHARKGSRLVAAVSHLRLPLTSAFFLDTQSIDAMQRVLERFLAFDD